MVTWDQAKLKARESLRRTPRRYFANTVRLKFVCLVVKCTSEMASKPSTILNSKKKEKVTEGKFRLFWIWVVFFSNNESHSSDSKTNSFVMFTKKFC